MVFISCVVKQDKKTQKIKANIKAAEQMVSTFDHMNVCMIVLVMCMVYNACFIKGTQQCICRPDSAGNNFLTIIQTFAMLYAILLSTNTATDKLCMY